MQSATLLEPHQSAPNDPLHNLTTGTHLSRMGPVPEFLRPLPVLSSSNGNTTLKYKKAAILNHNLKQEHDAKYYGKYDPIRKYETSENGYGGNKDVTTSGGDNENENNFNSKPSGNTVYPKHFASMQGPYGIINNNLFIKKEDKEGDEAKTRSRLDSDLLNNNTSDKNSSHMNYYSGQFQANFIGHINNQNYLNRPLTVPSSQPGYFNGHGNVSDRIDNSDPSSSQPESPNRQHPRGASPQKPENFPTNQETNPELGNKKFKVPTSKVPKESLLKYRILHKNNQRNVTQISNNPPAESPPTELNPSTNAGSISGLTGSISRNEAPCDSNSSTETSSVHFKRPDSDAPEPSGSLMNVHFKRPESDTSVTAPEPSGIHFKRPETDNLPEPSGSVINSDIKPNHFSKGVLIKLENGLIKHLEDLKTEDFVSSAEKSARHRLEPSTVMKIEEKEGASVVLTLCYGERKHQVEYESMIEQPYYVISKGWCSYHPTKTHNKYGLVCKQLNVGDICISLCQKSTPSKPCATSQAKTAKRKDLEKHFNQLMSKDREMIERKKRRWSAPDQIHEKGSKKLNAKLAKLSGEESTTVATLPTSTNPVQNGGEEYKMAPVSSPAYTTPSETPTSYFNYSIANSQSTSLNFPPIPSHLQYVNTPSSCSSTNPTHLITKPIVSHLPLTSASNFSISTLTSQHPLSMSTKPSYLIHSSPSLANTSSQSNFPTSTPSFASTPAFSGSPSISFPRPGTYPLPNPIKYSVPGHGGKNNFSNVGTLAKSASEQNAATGMSAVDFSKYSMKK
ncbi:hypothetical protein M8J76_005963 [Diaphorina citri]|nr:hypothetical protein M8J76_005963 [Diaphorina citri]